MVIGVGHLAVPQLVADLRQVSIVWFVHWVGCAGEGVCCSSMVLCGLGLAVDILSSRCGGGYVGPLAVPELRPSDVSSATGVGDMVLTWLGAGGWGRHVGGVAVSWCEVSWWGLVAGLALSLVVRGYVKGQ